MKGPLRVAVLGAGTVGREVVRAILERPESLRLADGPGVVLAGVAVRDLGRAIAGGIPESLLTDAPAHLVAAPETDVIVELMGGDEPARTLIAAALANGTSVVTANKHVMAHHGPALEAIARRTGAALRFEASVGGGIPVLGPIAHELAANRIDAVRGIVNGTTNFILSAMASDGRAYGDVLADAQRAGYAEADPRGDVEGDDAANKLVVLARQAFGRWLSVGSIGRAPSLASGELGLPGITGVTIEDIAAAAARGFAIKLVAQAVRAQNGVAAAVVPSAVTLASALGRTDGVLNRIEVDGVPVGRVAFAGPGAGGAATSSAVLGDIIAIARGAGSSWAGRSATTSLEDALDLAADETFDAPSGARYPVIR
ncbi:MAG: Homoserine dehydrogenase [Chloroflexi bacterium]|nr:Homoserine dehydrogenase [Chloroflexota bacterium]